MSAALVSVREDNAHTRNWLAEAAEMRDRARVKALLASGANADATTENGMTPLMYAALNGSAEIAQILIDGGAQVNAKRNDGLTAIDLAAFFGHMGVVSMLLQSGANPEVRGRVRTSAETWATVRGFVDIAETLREAIDGTFKYPKRSNSMSPRVNNRPSAPELVKPPTENPENAIAATAPDTTLASSLKENSKDSSLPAPLDAVHQLEHAVTQSTSRGSLSVGEELKSRASTPQFRPGLVFLERLTSSWRHLMLLTLAVMIVCGGATYGMLRTKAQNGATKINNPEKVTPAAPEKPTASVAVSANYVEPTTNPMAVNAKASAAQVSEVKPDTSTRIELAHKSDSRETPQQKQQPYTFAVFPNQTHAAPTRKTAAEWSPKRRNVSSIKIISSSTPHSEIMASSDSASSKPTAEIEEEPKPAPLTVSVSRTRSITAVPSNNDARGTDQGSPLLSTKPKRKVHPMALGFW